MVAQQLSERRLSRGDHVFQEGDHADALIIVAVGRIDVLRRGQVVASLDAGAVVAEEALLEGCRHRTSAVATASLVLLHLHRRPLLELLQGMAPVKAAVLRWLADRLRLYSGCAGASFAPAARRSGQVPARRRSAPRASAVSGPSAGLSRTRSDPGLRTDGGACTTPARGRSGEAAAGEQRLATQQHSGPAPELDSEDDSSGSSHSKGGDNRGRQAVAAAVEPRSQRGRGTAWRRATQLLDRNAISALPRQRGALALRAPVFSADILRLQAVMPRRVHHDSSGAGATAR